MLGGVKDYYEVEYTRTIFLPKKYAYCKECRPWFYHEFGYDRDMCLLTGEAIFDKYDIGQMCPLREVIEKERDMEHGIDSKKYR